MLGGSYHGLTMSAFPESPLPSRSVVLGRVIICVNGTLDAPIPAASRACVPPCTLHLGRVALACDRAADGAGRSPQRWSDLKILISRLAHSARVLFWPSVRWADGHCVCSHPNPQPPNPKIRFSPFKHQPPTCIAPVPGPSAFTPHFLGPPLRPPRRAPAPPPPRNLSRRNLGPASIAYDSPNAATTRGGRKGTFHSVVAGIRGSPRPRHPTPRLIPLNFVLSWLRTSFWVSGCACLARQTQPSDTRDPATSATPVMRMAW
jgi:hypothetical protein